MKASELVEKLNKMIEKHGDQRIVVDDDECEVYRPVHSIIVGISQDQVPFQFLIASKETALSFT